MPGIPVKSNEVDERMITQDAVVVLLFIIGSFIAGMWCYHTDFKERGR
jgi:hypothetical protein